MTTNPNPIKSGPALRGTRPALSSRYDGIQALRFLAAFLVLVTHATYYTSERLGQGDHTWYSGGTGVNIFFVISGFIMVVSSRNLMNTPGGWRTFLTRRLIRIVPMYWLATSVKLLFMLMLPAVVFHSTPSILHILSSYFFIPTLNAAGEAKPLLAVGWTLYFEMYFYILFSLGLFLRRNIYVSMCGILFVIFAVSLFRSESWPVAAMFVNPIVIQFALGMLVAYCTERISSLGFIAPLLLFVSGLTLLLMPSCMAAIAPPGLSANIPADIPAAMVVMGTVYLEPYLRVRGGLPKWLLFLGDASYVLYLFHPLASPLMPSILHRIGVTSFAVSVLGAMALGLLAGALIHHFVERPMTEAVKGLVSRRRIEVRSAE